MRRILAAMAAVALLTAAAPSARAQMAVVDVRAIAQAAQQLAQLQAQVRSLSSQALSAPLTSLNTINAQAAQILQSAGGIGFTGGNAAAQFQSLYPQVQSGNIQGLLQQYQRWQNEVQESLKTAYQAQSQVAQQQVAAANAVNGALSNSSGAAGETQAIQSTNQLLATVSTQLSQLQTILLTQARAQSAALAQQSTTNPASVAEMQRASAFVPQVSSHARDSAF